MNQEVQVTITLGVDVTVSKEQIKQYFLDMQNVYTSIASTHNRLMFEKFNNIEIKEEKDIYQNK